MCAGEAPYHSAAPQPCTRPPECPSSLPPPAVRKAIEDAPQGHQEGAQGEIAPSPPTGYTEFNEPCGHRKESPGETQNSPPLFLKAARAQTSAGTHWRVLHQSQGFQPAHAARVWEAHKGGATVPRRWLGPALTMGVSACDCPPQGL